MLFHYESLSCYLFFRLQLRHFIRFVKEFHIRKIKKIFQIVQSRAVFYDLSWVFMKKKCLFILDRALEIDQKNDCTQPWPGSPFCLSALLSEGQVTVRQLNRLKGSPDRALAGVLCSPSRQLVGESVSLSNCSLFIESWGWVCASCTFYKHPEPEPLLPSGGVLQVRGISCPIRKWL